MSDWNLSELEHIDWNEFGKSEDHIVPHRGGELVAKSLALCHSFEKPKHVDNDVGKIMCSTGSAISPVLWGKEDSSLSTMKNGGFSVLEGSRSRASNVLVPALHDFEHVTIPTSSYEAKISSYIVTDHNSNTDINKFNSKVPFYGTSVSTTKSCLSSLNGDSQDVAESSSLENEQKDRQNDLIYYDWPDIDNFENIDKMLSSDSTFGQGLTGTTDEFTWFSSSSNTIYASEITFEPEFQPSCSELGTLDGQGGQSVNDFQHQNVPTSSKHCSSDNEFYADWLDTDAQDNGKFVAKEVCGGAEKIDTLPPAHINNKNGLNGYSTSNMAESQPSSHKKGRKCSADRMFLDSDVTATQMYTSEQFSQQKQFLDCSSPIFIHNLNSHGKMECGLPRHHLSFTQSTSCTEFTNDIEPCSSLRGSDHNLNHQSRCFERRPDQFYMPQSMTQEENTKKVHQMQQLSARMIMEHPRQQAVFRSKTLAWRKQPETRDVVEREVLGLELPIVGINSPVAQENPWTTSVVSDDISLKATSFLQLQDLMDQLDVRTKLCIRDSLYRLARSAHQRNGFSHSNNSIETKIELLGFQGTEASKSLDPMDAETNTNPIDRSIAHLLFHKPLEAAPISLETATSVGSHVIDKQLHVPIITRQVTVPDQCGQRIFGGSTDTGFLHSDLPCGTGGRYESAT